MFPEHALNFYNFVKKLAKEKWGEGFFFYQHILSLRCVVNNGNDFSFPVLSPFLKLHDNDVKSFLNGYPIF